MTTGNQCEQGLFKSLAGFCCLLIATQCLQGCNALTRTPIQTETSLIQNQRIAEADRELRELVEIDSLVKLNNSWLASHFSKVLREQATSTGYLDIHKLTFKFARQFIYLEAAVDISDQYNNVISTSLTGDVTLDVSADHLNWVPRFGRVQIRSEDFSFGGADYGKAGRDLELNLLDILNSFIVKTLVKEGNNRIDFHPVPLGEVQVGAELPGFSTSPASLTQPLRGVFMAAGSALLIDKSSTTAALDMTFKPGLSECPANVTVSRAEFAMEIKKREPLGIANGGEPASEIRYFFSEISGAKRPLTIIHYWFANGLPLAAEELPVGPSKRWRTWSANGLGHSDGDRLDVLVVEKDSGCILLSKAIHTLKAGKPGFNENTVQTKRLFSQYRDEFSSRVNGFSLRHETPEIALMETRRIFVKDVLQASLKNLSMNAEFHESAYADLHYHAYLQAFDAADIVCEDRNCPPAPVCKINISHCKRYRDTRDCVSCVFRNPLNNRCISEARDPLCEAARKNQNNRYETERNSCIARAEKSRNECDQLNAQALRSCQIESGFASSICQSVKSSLGGIGPGALLAHVRTQAQSGGKLRVNFSNFRIEGDLERLKLDISLIPDLQLEGDIQFSPGAVSRTLDSCIAKWSSPFRSRFTAAAPVRNLLGSLEQRRDALIARWSGFGLTIDTSVSPLETRFVEDPQLLADCKIGLTVKQVEEAMTGDKAGFYRGHMTLEIQPLPTKIHLAPASVSIDGKIYSADAELSSTHLRYAVGGDKKSALQRP